MTKNNNYVLTRESLNSITDAEMAFGTMKLLPPFEMIPDEFHNGNIYTEILDCMFAGVKLPDGEIVFRKGFDDADAPKALHRCVHAHLISFEPKHEHKIAGLGYIISLVCQI